jgi:hypothetical protein
MARCLPHRVVRPRNLPSREPQVSFCPWCARNAEYFGWSIAFVMPHDESSVSLFLGLGVPSVNLVSPNLFKLRGDLLLLSELVLQARCWIGDSKVYECDTWRTTTLSRHTCSGSSSGIHWDPITPFPTAYRYPRSRDSWKLRCFHWIISTSPKREAQDGLFRVISSLRCPFVDSDEFVVLGIFVAMRWIIETEVHLAGSQWRCDPRERQALLWQVSW